ncbi:pentapeptide repeat-containing protein [Nocardioides mesophilus]|uniref:Pentapeptide repeat-containing protein n=1 Tax=Nocardioides mesophilus TaxID=433659 RepID=A0A7G9R9P1_9ACTN|nr:pentapeptide repeat-containing protein [Nocardioides mesophilus]QNN52316.1 pentapeptide repeat-containing protein [Nocardioides mesophilus]
MTGLTSLLLAVVAAWVLGWLKTGNASWLRDEKFTGNGAVFEIVRAAVTLLGVMGIAIGGALAYRRQRLGEDQFDLAQRQHKDVIARDRRDHEREVVSRLRDRFTIAAGQLGDGALAVRVAGVYAMANLADEWLIRAEGNALDRHEAQACVDVLCAYMRLPELGGGGQREDPGRTEVGVVPPDGEPAALGFVRDAEIRRTIIRVLVRHVRPEAPISWSELDFDFSGVHFDGFFDFSDARFSGQSLSFRGATFAEGLVTFDGAHFACSSVSFRDASLAAGDVSFDRAVFSSAQVAFIGAAFAGGRVSFSGAILDGGELTFRRSTLTGGVVSLSNAKLRGGKLSFNRAKLASGRLVFVGTTFEGARVSFNRARFECGEVSFSDAAFMAGSVTFHETEISFSMWIICNGATFNGGTLSFLGARFEGGGVTFAKARGQGPWPQGPWLGDVLPTRWPQSEPQPSARD